MSSPSKRRKKNNQEPSAGVRSLDFFFAKQQERQSAAPLQDAAASDFVEVPDAVGRGESTLTSDEELARRLQEQFDQEANSTEPGSGSHIVQNQSDHAVQATQSEQPPAPADAAVGTVHHELKKPATLSLQSVQRPQDQIINAIPFDESPLTFEPSKYANDLRRAWEPLGNVASYGLLTRCFVLVNGTQSRIKIVDTLTNFLRTLIEVEPSSLLPAVWLTTNAISPPYVSMELGLGGSAISKALKNVCGLDSSGLKALYDKHGDAGDVAFEAKKKQSFTLRAPKPLTILGVYHDLVKVANSKGTGSQETKQRVIERLLQGTQSAEQSRYLVRTLAQHLRIGAVKTTMLIALSRAFLLSQPPGAGPEFTTRSSAELAKLPKEALTEIYSRGEELVKASFARRPNYNDLVPCLLEIGLSDELLLRCGLDLHVPLRPMLGGITRDLGDMLTKLQGRDFSCEYKYDGQRAQVHCDGQGKVSIFSRHLELMTDKYPDLVALVPQIRGEGVSSFILEGEVVAVDRSTGELKAFQALTNRARKDVDIGAVTIDVCLFAFDLMYLNGESLLDRCFRERRELLRGLFVEQPGAFTWVKSLDATSADADAVLEFFKSALDTKCEGIMVKVLDNVAEVVPDQTEQTAEAPPPKAAAPRTPKKKSTKTKTSTDKDEKPTGSRRKALLSTYEPDKRLDSWLKVKKDYDASTDTLDLIPIAGWHGQGRKAKWWSPILLAVRDPQSGSLQAVTKCISGFTDKFYQANKDKYAEGGPHVISKPSYVEYEGRPDVWFEPQEVWEMVFADITLSPTYTAAIGLVSEDRGLSMRFPRFLKVREDKGIDEASTADFLASLYRKQQAKKTDAGGAGDEEEGDE